MKHSFFVALSVAAVLVFSACKKDKKVETPAKTTYKVGDSHAGGIVFYVDASGEHGLIAATTDQGTAVWGCHGTDIDGAHPLDIGFGQANTTAIKTACTATDIAAYMCDTLRLGGYTDWYLPTQKELKELFDSNALTFSGSDHYWSSSSVEPNFAYNIQSDNKQIWGTLKTTSYKVRAIRSF